MGGISACFRVTEGKPVCCPVQEPSDLGHLPQRQESFAQKIFREVDDDSSMQFLRATREWLGAPTVGQAGPEQHQISWTVICNSVAHQALSMAVHNERKFVFRMIVPKKRELRRNPRECRKWRCTARQFFKVRQHANIMKILTPFVKKSRHFCQWSTYIGQCEIRQRRIARLGCRKFPRASADVLGGGALERKEPL